MKDGDYQTQQNESYNAIVLQKNDVESPIFRVDMIIEKVVPKQIFEVLKDQSQIQNWFGKQIQSKFHSTLPTDGSEIFTTVYKAPYPLNNRELIHRRLINCDDSKNIYMFNYTTQGLDNVSIILHFITILQI